MSFYTNLVENKKKEEKSDSFVHGHSALVATTLEYDGRTQNYSSAHLGNCLQLDAIETSFVH